MSKAFELPICRGAIVAGAGRGSAGVGDLLGMPEAKGTRLRPGVVDHWIAGCAVRLHCAAAGHVGLAKLGWGTVSKILRSNGVCPHKIEYQAKKTSSDLLGPMAAP